MGLIIPIIVKRYEDAASVNFKNHKRSKIKLLVFFLQKHYKGVYKIIKNFLILKKNYISFLEKYELQASKSIINTAVVSKKPCVSCKESEKHLEPSERTNISTNKVSLVCSKCNENLCRKHVITLCKKCHDEETN
jgi:hypothetical protein